MVNVSGNRPVGYSGRVSKKVDVPIRRFPGTVKEVILSGKRDARLLGIVVEPVTPSRSHGCLNVFVPGIEIPTNLVEKVKQTGAIVNVETKGEYNELKDGRRLEIARVI